MAESPRGPEIGVGGPHRAVARPRSAGGGDGETRGGAEYGAVGHLGASGTNHDAGLGIAAHRGLSWLSFSVREAFTSPGMSMPREVTEAGLYLYVHTRAMLISCHSRRCKIGKVRPLELRLG